MIINRTSIDDHMAAVRVAGGFPGLEGAVRNLSALKSIAVALDQVVNRAQDEARRWGEVDHASAAHRGDLDHARQQVRVLEAGAAVGRAMIAAIEAQVAPPPPAPAESPPAPAEAPKKAPK